MEPQGKIKASATFSSVIQVLVNKYLFLAVSMVYNTNQDVTQMFIKVGKYDKRTKLLEILQNSDFHRTLVFVENTRSADFLASVLSQSSFLSMSLFGDEQIREEVLNEFHANQMPILITTDVGVQGLDINDVRHIVNYDLPESIAEYVSRTGRVGNMGTVTTFFDPACDLPIARNLVQALADALQDVPEFLLEAAKEGGENLPNGGVAE